MSAALDRLKVYSGNRIVPGGRPLVVIEALECGQSISGHYFAFLETNDMAPLYRQGYLESQERLHASGDYLITLAVQVWAGYCQSHLNVAWNEHYAPKIPLELRAQWIELVESDVEYLKVFLLQRPSALNLLEAKALTRELKVLVRAIRKVRLVWDV